MHTARLLIRKRVGAVQGVLSITGSDIITLPSPWTDRHLWKYYRTPTSFAGRNKTWKEAMCMFLDYLQK